MQIARAYADQGSGVVAVRHDLNLTAKFADSVALMTGGALLAQDPPARVLCDGLLSRTYLLPHAAAMAAEKPMTGALFMDLLARWSDIQDFLDNGARRSGSSPRCRS